MTPERRQELRDWSARLMGWSQKGVGSGKYPKFSIEKYGPNGEFEGVWVWLTPKCVSYEWTPDLPSAPASQILSVIERMRELGFNFSVSGIGSGYEAEFGTIQGGFLISGDEEYYGRADTLPEAVLLAAHAAWLAGKGGSDGR